VTKYQVHFEYPDKQTSRLKRGIRHVNAHDDREAIAKVRSLMPLSSGHWINVLANEVA
jgi:hypothetical protein